MFTHNINPILFNLGPLEIRWYGLFYVIGFLFAIFWFKKFADKLNEEEVYDLIFHIIIGGILGSRLGYIIFYNLSYYFSNPLKVFAVWEGGMSFHGGAIGALIAIYFFIKHMKKKGKEISFYYIADLAVIPLALALFLGRIGNFINGELYGYVTNLPWCVKFKGAEGCRHPSQLYESSKNLFIAFSLYLISRKDNLKEGTLMWSFILLYGILRFTVEFVRYSDTFYLGFTMGQILSSVMILAGSIMLIRRK